MNKKSGKKDFSPNLKKNIHLCLGGAGKGETADQEDGHDKVGEERGEVGHLAGAPDAPAQSEEDEEPRDQEAEAQASVRGAQTLHTHVPDLLQHSRLEILLRGRDVGSGVTRRQEDGVCVIVTSIQP